MNQGYVQVTVDPADSRATLSAPAPFGIVVQAVKTGGDLPWQENRQAAIPPRQFGRHFHMSLINTAEQLVLQLSLARDQTIQVFYLDT